MIRKVALLLLSMTIAAPAQQALPLSGDVQGTHDPSIAKDGDTWYVFATGKAPDDGQFAIRCSTDRTHWKLCGHVFHAIPAWIHALSPGTEELWAPDVAYVDGEYRIYYAYSLFGKNTSGIALVTNRTLDPKSPNYKWIDKGLVFVSKATDNYNAIDPNFIRDAQGHDWLSFGSFWDGIKMWRLDNKTGLLSKSDTRIYDLARRARPANPEPNPPGLPGNWQAVEAPFIVAHHGFYYLFTSWDLCCRGLKSTYRTMIGRSKQITGPYLDESGIPLTQGGGTELLGKNTRWLGPGGESILMDPKSQDLIVYHAYDATTGKPSMQISTIDWTNDWPHLALEQ